MELLNKMPLELSTFSYVKFRLERYDFLITISKVFEIIALRDPLTLLPKTSPLVRGLAPLRGKLIFILDLRLILDLPPLFQQREYCIVSSQKDRYVGLIVDQVLEVCSYPLEDFEEVSSSTLPPPFLHYKISKKIKDSPTFLLPLEKMLENLSFF
jgi:chemotaxis signal transduction protein